MIFIEEALQGLEMARRCFISLLTVLSKAVQQQETKL